MKINSQIENEINHCVHALKKGEFIIFPGETGWQLGCDASREAMATTLKSSFSSGYPAILLDDAGRLNKFVKDVPDTLYDLVEYSTKPLNIFLSGVVNLPASLLDEQQACAFRIVKDAFSQTMLYKFAKPVMAASLAAYQPPFAALKGILNTPAYMVNLRISSKSTPDSLVIIRMEPGGRIAFIRK